MYHIWYVYVYPGKQIKVDIRSDRGAYVGLLTIFDWDIITPCSISSHEFESARKKLVGFNEVSKSFALDALHIPAHCKISDSADVEIELISRVKRLFNMHLVQGAGVGELMFAGVIRKGFLEEKVYLTVLTLG